MGKGAGLRLREGGEGEEEVGEGGGMVNEGGFDQEGVDLGELGAGSSDFDQGFELQVMGWWFVGRRLAGFC